MEQSKYRPTTAQVFFGVDCVNELAGEAARLKQTRSVFICSPARTEMAETLAADFASDKVTVCAAARPNIPEVAFKQVLGTIVDFGADGLVAIGGGSPIGLGKAVAAATHLPLIAVPTTYSGSELASNWYFGTGTDQHRGKDSHALPSAVFYDPRLTLGLPTSTTAASGMNAMAHAIESLYGLDTNPVVQVMAEKAIHLLGNNLPQIVDHPGDLDARTQALQGAWFAAGFRARAGLEHAIAQRLRQAFNLDHAKTHAVSLPYVVAFNSTVAATQINSVARALDVSDAAAGIYALNRRLGLATGLCDLGMPASGIERATDIIAAADFVNPRLASREQIRQLIEAIWVGEPPTYF